MNAFELLRKKLSDLNIEVSYYQHEPIFTAEEGLRYTSHIPGTAAKNLFLKDKKKQFWLIVLSSTSKLHIRKLATVIGAQELQFAKPDSLLHHLGVTPGSVTPLALINNTSHTVHVIIDEALVHSSLIQIHPLRNDMTVTITPGDLLAFIKSCSHDYKIIDLASLNT